MRFCFFSSSKCKQTLQIWKISVANEVKMANHHNNRIFMVMVIQVKQDQDEDDSEAI